MVNYKEPPRGAPCKNACPLGMDVPRYIRLIAEGKFEEALAVIREKTPLASVCGYLCFHPCEAKCQRNEFGGPLAIRALKRFAAAGRSIAEFQPLPAATTGKSVAVVGSGPAGLTAAYHLARLGHAVTVFEARPEAGGTIREYIPAYRMPDDVLNAEIDIVKQAGVNIKTNARVASLEALFKEGFQAVFVTVGAHKSQKMGIEGEDSPGVKDCLAFLRDVKLGDKIKLGARVAVIGGGNAAIDAARTSLRLGATNVTIFYRRSWNEMPANMAEVEAALAEGVHVQFMTTPVRITAGGGKLVMACVRLSLGAVDASGRRRPENIPDSEFTVEVDSIISAIGQVPDVPGEFGLATGEGGTIQVTDSLATSLPGVFAGGDAVSGPANVTEAIAAGRKAAASIDIYLGGRGLIEEALAAPRKMAPYRISLPVVSRTKLPIKPVKERVRNFDEVELTLDEKAAIGEARRCLWCDLPIKVEASKCAGCRTCQVRCSAINLGVFNPLKSYITVVRDHAIRTTELRFSDECKHCGQCVAVCNYGALTRAYRGM